jgi:transposase-like protein
MNDIQSRLRALLPLYDGSVFLLARALRERGVNVIEATVRNWVNGTSHPQRTNEIAAMRAIADIEAERFDESVGRIFDRHGRSLARLGE